MRVLALTHVFPRSVDDAAAPFLLRWAQGLADAAASVVVVAPHDAGLPARHVVGRIPVRRVRYGPDAWERLAYRGEMHALVRSPAGPPLLACLVGGLAVAVRALVHAGRPDVLAVHWWLPGAVIARLAGGAPGLGVPVVVHVHGTDVALLEGRPRLAALARWALEGVTRVEAVSHDLAERLEAATGRRADAVNPMPMAFVPSAYVPSQHGPMASDPRRPLESAAARPFTVLGVGRLVEDKGFDELLDAVALLQRPARVVVVGEGPHGAALAERAARLGVALELTGRLAPEELGVRYAAADVVAQPSRREGLGLVAAEAVVAGIAVVATDSGGVRDVLGSDGLVAVGDVAGLAAALERVAADPDAARLRSSSRARAVAALLSPEASAQRTLAGYRAVVEP